MRHHDLAHAFDLADLEDDGALLEPLDLLLAELPRQLLVLVARPRLFLDGAARVGVGDVHGLAREQDAVLVVAAHAGRVHVTRQVNDARRVGALGDDVAREDEVVLGGAEVDFLE